MSQQATMAFAERMLTDDEFQRGAAAAVADRTGRRATDALIRYAAQRGLDVTASELAAVRDSMTSDDELSEECLAAVAGGTDQSGDDAQLANVDLQNVLQTQQQTIQMMSNISKTMHDTAMAVIRKIGG